MKPPEHGLQSGPEKRFHNHTWNFLVKIFALSSSQRSIDIAVSGLSATFIIPPHMANFFFMCTKDV